MADEYVRPYASIYVDGEWEDITTDFFGLDGKSAFDLKHGQQNQTSRISYGSASARLKNTDSRYSPRNANSDLYGYLNRNIACRLGVDHVKMNFATPVTDGWGSSDADVNGDIPGVAWTLSGAAANFDVASGVGTIVSSGTLTDHAAVLGSYGEAEIRVKVKVSSLTTDPEFGIIALWQGTSAYCKFYLDAASGGTVKIRYNTTDGGTVYTDAGSFTIVADTYYWLVASLGKRLRVKAFADGADEPTEWTFDQFHYDPFDHGFNLPYGGVGVFIREGTNTTVLTVDQFEAFNPRMHGEIASFVPSADSTNTLRYTDIQIAGILRRLNVGEQQNLISPLRREAIKESTLQYAAGYWPCEDGSGATAPSSGLTNGSPMRVIGEQPSYASSSLISGAAPLMVMRTGGVSAVLPATPNTSGSVFYRMVMVHAETEIANGAIICELYTTGSAVRWALTYGTGGSLQLSAYNVSGTLIDQTGVIAFDVVPESRFYASIELVQDGADVDVLLAVNKITTDGNDIAGTVLTDTLVGLTIGVCGGISVGLNGTLEGCALGHIGVGNNQSFMFSTDALIGFSGERASARMSRLCSENSIEFYLCSESDSDTAVVGPQVIGTLAQNLQYAADTDQGILFEPRSALAVGYRSRTWLFHQRPVVLDYEGGYLDNQLAPTEDDALLANDVTAKRVNGGEARVVISTGPNNNQPPPDGVGVYTPNPPVNVITQTDLALLDIAAFRAFIGTWDAARYPLISVNLSRRQFTVTNPDLRAQMASLSEGDYLQIQNPPSWLPQENIDLMSQGYKDVWGQLMWTRTLNTTPYGPYLVAITDSASQRVAGGTDMVLTTNTLENDTSIISQSVSGHQKWCMTTDDADGAADFPFDVVMSGERMTVTATAHGFRDIFDRVVAAGGLGTATDGHVWVPNSGTGSFWSVNGTKGLCALSTPVNVEQHIYIDLEANFNQEMRLEYLLPATPTGAPINIGILLRYTDVNNYYWCDIQTQTTGVITLRLIKRTAGAVTVLGTEDVVGLVHSSVAARAIRAQALGSTLRMMVFDPALAEAPRWQITATDSDHLTNTITKAGIITRLTTGNTNATPVTIEFDNAIAYSPQILTVTRSVNGVVKFNGPGQPIEVLDRAYVGR